MKKTRFLALLVVAFVAVSSLATPAFAQSNGGDKPGWGFGDKHHHHTGPPGHSVFPGPSDRPGDGDDLGKANEDHISSQNLSKLFAQFEKELHNFFFHLG